MTINDVVNYVFLHPDGYSKVFKGWTEHQLVQAVQEAIKENCFAWSEKNGKVNGIVLAKKVEGNHLHIIGILVSDKEALRGMLKKYYELYPDWKLTGRRKNVVREFSKHHKLLWNLKSIYQ